MKITHTPIIYMYIKKKGKEWSDNSPSRETHQGDAAWALDLELLGACVLCRGRRPWIESAMEEARGSHGLPEKVIERA